MVYVDGKECLAISIVHVDGKALMKHDPSTQRLCTTVTKVKRDDFLNILTGDIKTDPILKKVSEFIDIDRNLIKSAFAYSALKDVINTFGLDEIIDSDNIKLVHNKKRTAEICLGDNHDKDVQVFSISIQPSRAKLDELSQEFVLVERNKIITKPSSTPQEDRMDFYFMGMKIEKLSGTAILLFWDITFI